MSRVREPSSLPVLLDLQLRPNWEQVTPYATIAGVEARMNPPEVYAFPTDLQRSVVKRSLATTPLVPFQPGRLPALAALVAAARREATAKDPVEIKKPRRENELPYSIEASLIVNASDGPLGRAVYYDTRNLQGKRGVSGIPFDFEVARV